MLSTLSQSSLFRWGFYLNWFGAATVMGVIPLVAILTLLPLRNWVLAAVPLIDLVATFSLRLMLYPNFQRDRMIKSSYRDTFGFALRRCAYGSSLPSRRLWSRIQNTRQDITVAYGEEIE